MGFWAIVLYVGFTLLSSALKPRTHRTPERARTEDFDIPTVDPGRPIPIVQGSCYIQDPNVVWWGSLRSNRWNGTGTFSNAGTEYDLFFVAFQIAICHGPVDPGITIYWDKKQMIPTELVDHPELDFAYQRIRKNRMIGMFTRDMFLQGVDYDAFEGNYADVYYFYRGTFDQPADTVMPQAEFANAPIPPYRGLAYIFAPFVAVGPAFGSVPSMQQIALQVVRRPNSLGLSSNHHIVGNDANPACMIYEILTDQRWGAGLPAAAIDTDAFRAAGETLHEEGFGLSLLTNDQQPVRDMVNEILRHIDGAVFTDPVTGLLTIKLFRDDYVFADLPVYDESVCENIQLSRPSWTETKNKVRLRYRGPQGSERIATEEDLANVQKQGGLVVEDLVFQGITDPELAQSVAARELKTLSYPFARVSFEINRKGWALRPGDVFRLTSRTNNFEDLVCRVRNVSSGSLLDGRIRVDAAEDSFAVNWTGVAAGLFTNWSDPVSIPNAVAAQRLVEAPYALAGGNHRKLLALGARGAGFTQGIEIWSDAAGGTSYVRTNPRASFTPSGILYGALDYVAETFTIQAPTDTTLLRDVTDAELAAGFNLVLIDDELIAWKTFVTNDDGSLTFSGAVRGVADTAERLHSAGSRVWFISRGASLVRPEAYGSDVTVNAKLPAYNTAGATSLASTPQVSKLLASRASRPYVPTDVKLNGVSYPATRTGELTVSWSHRNRLGSWSYADAGVTGSPEPGTTYTVRIYKPGAAGTGYGEDWGASWGGSSGELVHEETGITGTSWTYPAATEIAEAGAEIATPRVVVLAVVGGVESHQVYDYTVGSQRGYGVGWGNNWGG